ncbi:hypothetical protein WK68_14745 [Burkholderia ubonensis]|uniref:hypothetical protein n=1 Tax=Burkholderia ubonensis TaxID=101571 RepID=UPI000752A526|nr:hypothetical protein [Burkholderia ubonensis]KVU38840.1 hypothetical protein WK68_14745 [Burkholderia ubonensis]
MKRLAVPFRPKWILARWEIACLEQAMGIAGKLALLILVLAMLVRACFVMPTRHVIEQRRHETVIAIDEAKRAESKLEDDVAASRPRAFPTAQAFTTRTMTIVTLLQNAGFAVQTATFKQSRIGKMPLEQLNVEFPLTGNYPDVRQTLARLETIPGCRIDGVSIERKAIGETQGQIRVRIRLIGVTS